MWYSNLFTLSYCNFKKGKLFSTSKEIASIHCNLGLKAKVCNLSSTLLKNIRHQRSCSSNTFPYMVTYHVWYCRMNLIWISIQCTQHTEYYLILQCRVIEHTDHGSRILAQPCTALHCFPLLSLGFLLLVFFFLPTSEDWALPSHDQEEFDSQALCLAPGLHSPALGIAQQMSHPMQQPPLSLCTYKLTHIYMYR